MVVWLRGRWIRCHSCIVAMVALVATEPTLVATEPTLVATEATLGVTKATQADRFGLVHHTHLRCTLGSCN
jgi:hypothetical protein